MAIFLQGNVIANNGGAGVLVQGLRAAVNFDLTMIENFIHGNRNGGLVFDFGADRRMLGVPDAISDEALLDAAQLAKRHERATAIDKIKSLVSWDDVTAKSAGLVERLVDLIQGQ